MYQHKYQSSLFDVSIHPQILRNIPQYILKNFKTGYNEIINNQPKTINIATLNAINTSSISEYLIKNLICGKSYYETKFKLLRRCNNVFDIIKIEAIYIHLNKPKLCKQKNFDYSLSLFS